MRRGLCGSIIHFRFPQHFAMQFILKLMTMPISPWEAIIGKFLAAAMVWFTALLLTFPIVWTVYYLGQPDSGPIISAYNASFLYAVACLAVTSAVSAFTRSQVICFIIS